MSKPHPLTDEACETISGLDLSRWGEPGIYIKNDMRAAADWQLKQVIEWLHDNLYWVEEDGSIRYLDQFCSLSGARVSIDKHGIINDLKKAMRPQEDNS